MKVVFVCRSNNHLDIAPFIASQQDSLEAAGVEILGFLIIESSMFSYFLSIFSLKKFINANQIDIIHAHYSLSGLTAVLALSGKPVVLSLMGSDILGEHITQNKIPFRSKIVILITRFVQYFVDAIIVKSQNIYDQVSRKSITSIIPNGMDLQIFKPINKLESRKTLGLSQDKKYILFLANPSNTWKNFKLAEEAVRLLKIPDIILLAPYHVTHNKIPFYLNAVDVFISTSFMEGSSNVIKEAMACNCPIVATDVGDAKWVIGNTVGCYISSFNPNDFAYWLKDALSYAEKNDRTNGRQRIIELGLDSASIADRLINIYTNVLQ